MSTGEETTPHRARRLGREYAETFHDRWSPDGRKWIRFAFAKGYEAACKDQAFEANAMDVAVTEWELGVISDEELVNGYLDPWLEKIQGRVPEVRPA